MSKFKALDVVIGTADGTWKGTGPVVVLGTHIFPSGEPAYRFRMCLPGYDYEDGSEHWDKNDGYISQSFLDRFDLLWRKDG